MSHVINNSAPDLGRELQERSFALLIGIDRYSKQNGRLPPLKCAAKDVRALAKVLEEAGGFPKENVFVLIDEQATRPGISAAFSKLAISLRALGRSAHRRGRGFCSTSRATA